MPEPTRVEKDSMGLMSVPAHALWGASTQRAVENFPVSGYRFGRRFIRALGLIKQSAAEINLEMGLLTERPARALIAAAQEVIDGRLDDHFVLDIFQTGSGTSTNMNANEVIANRAIQILGGAPGSKDVHPNDHVNVQQSSNDVIPTAIHVAVAEALVADLVPAARRLHAELARKAAAFDAIVKIGRTHLQDATPIRLGQEFSGYAAQIALAEQRAHKAVRALRELPIGGTAVGTGLNAHPEFGRRMAERLAKKTGIEFAEAGDHFEAQHAQDAVVEASGHVRTVAVSLTKIANDLRWLASGPRCGIGEIRLPATQPGSSIMPGKVNPVMCEMVLQAAAWAIGADATVAFAGATLGTFDLHVGMPVMAHPLLESIRILSRAMTIFAERCVAGIEADEKRCAELVEQSLAMCTSLAPVIGYDRAAEIAKKAHATGRTVRQVCLDDKVLPPEQLARLLDPAEMTRPSGDRIGPGGG